MKQFLLALFVLCAASVSAYAAAVKPMLVKHQNGSFALDYPGYVLSKSLAADTAESFTVPANAGYVLFAGTCNYYVNYTTTATVPGDVTDGTASELNPTIRRITSSITSISVIASDACVVTASFYL